LSLADKFEEYKNNVKLITKKYIEYKFDSFHLKLFKESLGDISKYKINRDFSPIQLVYTLSYWSSMYSDGVLKIFRLVEKIKWISVIVVLLLFFIIINTGRRTVFPLIIFSTGFAGMIYNLIFIFAFQISYGIVYREIGLIIALIMAGIAFGAWFSSLFTETKKLLKYIIYSEVSLVILSVIFPVMIILFYKYAGISSIAYYSFFIIAFISGIFIGAQFPLVSSIYIRKYHASVSDTAGSLFAYDMLGGWAGGVLGAVIILPIFGMINSCIILFMVKVCTMIGLILWIKRR